MPVISLTCLNPRCGKVVQKRWGLSAPRPKYCGVPCAREATRTYEFSEGMNAQIRAASRSGYGALKTLWRDDPRFAVAGIPYPIFKRQLQVLGLTMPGYNLPWAEAELAYALAMWERDCKPDVIARAMRKQGWCRSPGAIIAQMQQRFPHQQHQGFLTTAEVAQAFGVDLTTVLGWSRTGVLPVHHTSPGARRTRKYYSYTAVRHFIVENPYKVARGTPDIVWLIGMLTTPSAGNVFDTVAD
jgi:hypothetical protein